MSACWVRLGPSRLTAAAALAIASCLTGAVAGSQARGGAPTPQAPAVPRLVVLLVVDQFRADYVERYGGAWRNGLRLLLDHGAYFPEAAMPYGITKTCAGHSSIGTGTVPATHGLIDNDWYDVREQRYVACTDDPSASSVGFGGQRGQEHHSARWLRVTTFADELRRQAPRAPRIAALALKARAAISLVGHGGAGSVVLWEEDTGVWATSTAFTTTPWPDVDAAVRLHTSGADRGRVWDRLRPASTYLFEDEAPGEPAATFPHALDAPLGGSYIGVWDASPWSDAYLGNLAIALTDKMRLGQGVGTDMLAISFSALDYVGHAYGPRSHEVQDVLARLDVVIGQIVSMLDRTVGRDKYVLAFTSDHGVAPLPEQRQGPGGTGGRVSLNALANMIELTLNVELGRGSYLEAAANPYVYFRPGVLDRLRARPEAMAAVERAARSVPGVDRTYWATDLRSTTPTADPILTLMRRSYAVGRSGDLAFVAKPYWVVTEAGTNHGSPYDYDAQVPLVLFGHGISPGRYVSEASPVDIVPTLARLVGITMPRTDGRVLTEALTK